MPDKPIELLNEVTEYGWVIRVYPKDYEYPNCTCIKYVQSFFLESRQEAQKVIDEYSKQLYYCEFSILPAIRYWKNFPPEVAKTLVALPDGRSFAAQKESKK